MGALPMNLAVLDLDKGVLPTSDALVHGVKRRVEYVPELRKLGINQRRRGYRLRQQLVLVGPGGFIDQVVFEAPISATVAAIDITGFDPITAMPISSVVTSGS